MTNQTQAPIPETKLPFILRTLRWATPTATPTDVTSPSQMKVSQEPSWDVSHMANRSYDLEYIGSLTPPVPIEQPPPPPPHATRVRKTPSQYNPHLLPELTFKQVNDLYMVILGNSKHWNGMTNFLQIQFIDGKMDECEFTEWKDMCRSVKKLNTMNVVDREKFQRAFCNSFLLWFVAVDIRYKYEAADEFAKMVKAPQLTLIISGHLLFALYKVEWIEASELEDLVAKLHVSADSETEEHEEESADSAVDEDSS